VRLLLVYPPLSSASSASSSSRSSALGSLIYMLLENLLRPATRSDSRLLKLAGYRPGRFVSLDSTIAIDASRVDAKVLPATTGEERGEMPQSSTRRISRCISGFSTGRHRDAVPFEVGEVLLGSFSPLPRRILFDFARQLSWRPSRTPDSARCSSPSRMPDVRSRRSSRRSCDPRRVL